MNNIIFYASLFPILLSLIGIFYFVYLHKKLEWKTSFRNLIIIVIIITVAMSGFRVWYNLNYSTVDCNDVGQCFVGWGEQNGNINNEDIEALAHLNYSLDDAPIPYIVWEVWSTVFGVNDVSFLVVTEIILSFIGVIIFVYTKKLFPFLLFQLTPLTLSLTNTFAVLDDVVGFLFFTVIVVLVESRNMGKKKWIYPLTVLTVLSHKLPSLYLVAYFLFKREYKSLFLVSSFIVGALAVGFLGYLGKTALFGRGGIVVEPLLFFVGNTSYLVQLLVVAQALFLGIYFVKTRNSGGRVLLFLAIVPLIVPFNSVDHTLLWRMVWLNIVLVPLLFHEK